MQSQRPEYRLQCTLHPPSSLLRAPTARVSGHARHDARDGSSVRGERPRAAPAACGCGGAGA
eukprot:4124157-Prymnesium_polylepis.2